MIIRRGFPALAFSLQMEPEVLPPVVTKIIPTKGSWWPKSTTKNISLLFTKTYHFPGRLRGKSYRTIVAGTQQMDGTWKHLKKWRPPSMLQKNKTCTKKGTLGPTAGHGVTTLPCCRLWLLLTSALAPLASRRGKNWKSECRPDMIRMIENHRFLMFFLALEEQNRVTAQAKRKFSLLSHTPANRNECPCCKHFLTTPANTSILSLTLKNQNFKFVTLTRAPSQPVALFLLHNVPTLEVKTVI